jgi:hypothetical protein
VADADETSLEKTFSDLANSRLRDAAPALLEYLVGFQIIDNDEDGSRCVGIFGCEIGESFYYVPCFFLNGQIKGLDSIYSEESDLFTPLDDEWIDLLINRRPNQIGETDTRSKQDRGTQVPNYTRLRTIPSGGSSNFGFTKDASDLCGTMAAPRDSDPTESLSDLLPLFGPKVARGFLDDLKRHPKLAEAVQRFYDVTEFETTLPKLAAKADKVTIISNIAQTGAETLSDSEKEQLVRGGVGVIDNRPDVDKAIVYTTRTKETMQNPGHGGMYEVLMSNGDIKTLFCFNVLSGDSFLCYDPESGKHGIVPSHHIWTIQQHEKAEFHDKLKSESVEPSAVRPNDCVVFCNQSGDCTLGFEIDSAETSEGELKTLGVHCSYWLDALGSSALQHCGYSKMDYLTGPAPWRYKKPSERVKEVVVTDAGSGAIRYLANKLVVNNRRFRALILNRTKQNSDGYSEGSYDPDKKFNLSDFGDHQTVRVALDKTASQIKVWSDGHEITIRDQDGTHQITAPNAIAHLIRKHACSVEDARMVVDDAVRDATVYYVQYPSLAKQAAHLLGFPDMPDTTNGSEMGQFHQGQIPLSLTEKATPEGNRQYYTYQSPFGGGSDEDQGGQGGPEKSKGQDTAKAVQTAAQTGQKDVFDASVLGSLVKSHNPTDLVERFLPTIVSGMDRLGRLLFVLNWHYEDFEERYGKDDLMEFQDNLKSTFESLGQLVVFMKRRTLAGDPSHYGLGLNANMDG